MLQEIQSSRQPVPTEQWQAEVCCYLQQRAAVRAAEIAAWLGVAEPAVRQCLEQFAQAGQVEVLRPLGRPSGAVPDMDYFRWRQANDDSCLWQTRLHM